MLDSIRRFTFDSSGRPNYRIDMHPDVLRMVEEASSVRNLEKTLNADLQRARNAEIISEQEAFPREVLGLLFSFGSSPCDMATAFKNLQVSTVARNLVDSRFYSSLNYKSALSPEKIEADISNDFNNVPLPQGDTLYSRVKQPKSLILKLERGLVDIERRTPQFPLSDEETISAFFGFCTKISADPIKYLDDLIGYQWIINDLRMGENERKEALTARSSFVFQKFKTVQGITCTLVRKQSRVEGYEAVNLFTQGLLDHKDLGRLPVKFEFRFLKAMFQEAAMYYTHKMYDLWQLPPWAEEINFDLISTLSQLQEAMFYNFRRWYCCEK